MKQYKKHPTTIPEQIQLLKDRGLRIDDEGFAKKILKDVNYYRLSIYLKQFQSSQDRFDAGICFEDVYDLYVFDAKLRHIIFKVIQIIEIAIRSRVINVLSLKYGATCYFYKKMYMQGARDFDYKEWKRSVLENFKNAKKEVFQKHFRMNYGGSKHPPVWMLMETQSFGKVVKLLRDGIKSDDFTDIAQDFWEGDIKFLKSWLLTTSHLRNVCAHHGRLYNRYISIAPRVPNDKRWISAMNMDAKHLFATLTILKYLLNKLKAENTFKADLSRLFRKYSAVNIAKIGFSQDWCDHYIWKTNKSF